VSLAAHVALLAAWMSTRPDLRVAEPPTLQVQLVRPPPKPAPEPRRPSPPRTHSEPRPLELHQPVDPPPAISPEWTVKPEPPSAADLAGAPFATGRARRQARRPSCKPTPGSWERPASCPPDDAEIAASKFDAAKDSQTAGFEGAGRYKRANKRYHELEGTAGYPGLRCAILHRC
jgi:hypothetical protein